MDLALDCRGVGMVEKIILVAVFVFVAGAGVRQFARSGNQALKCQGQMVADLNGGFKCDATAAPTGTAPAPGGGAITCRGASCAAGGGDGLPSSTSSLCFVAGTPVMTTVGLLPIEFIEPGTLVLARDDDGAGVDWKPVVEVFRSTSRSLVRLKIVTAEGASETIEGTPNHPFYSSERGWLEMRDLVPGEDAVLDMWGGTMQVVSAESLSEQVPVYNFEVEGYHTYFVGRNGVWVHNPRRVKKPRPGVYHGQVGTYHDMNQINLVGDDLEHDHIPSDKAMIAHLNNQRRAQGLPPLTKEEAKIVTQNLPTIVIPSAIHKAGRTYGGKNNKTKIAADGLDPEGAFAADLGYHQKQWDRYGISRTQQAQWIDDLRRSHIEQGTGLFGSSIDPRLWGDGMTPQFSNTSMQAAPVVSNSGYPSGSAAQYYNSGPTPQAGPSQNNGYGGYGAGSSSGYAPYSSSYSAAPTYAGSSYGPSYGYGPSGYPATSGGYYNPPPPQAPPVYYQQAPQAPVYYQQRAVPVAPASGYPYTAPSSRSVYQGGHSWNTNCG